MIKFGRKLSRLFQPICFFLRQLLFWLPKSAKKQELKDSEDAF